MSCRLQGGAVYCSINSTAGQPTVVLAKSVTNPAATDACDITVTFPNTNWPSTLVQTVTVDVLQISSLVLRPQNYDVTGATGNLATLAAPPAPSTTLQQIKCNSSDYEQVRAVSLLVQSLVF